MNETINKFIKCKISEQKNIDVINVSLGIIFKKKYFERGKIDII